MGLIKNNYTIDNLGVTVDEVYAKIVVLTSEKEGQSVVTLQIRKTREDFSNDELQPIKQTSIQFVADKNLPLWEQGYNVTKNNEEFTDWTDDIII